MTESPVRGPGAVRRGPSLGEFLESDHQRLDRLWDSASEALPTDPAGARARYREFAEGLRRHIDAEEEELFPFLERNSVPLAPHLIATLREEHVEIREALDALLGEVERAGSGVERAELRLRDLLWSHNAREEGSLYGWLDAPFREGAGATADAAIRRRLPG